MSAPAFGPIAPRLIDQAQRFFEIDSLHGKQPSAVRARMSVAIVLADRGWSPARIAGRTGISPSTLGKNLSAGLQRLADGTDPELNDAVIHLERLVPA